MKPMPGYIMVEANGLDVSNTEVQIIPGLYSRLIKALDTGKAIMLTGLKNGDANISPVYAVAATITLPGSITAVAFSLPGFAAAVTDNDEVNPTES